ncbi:hypothetical protein MPSEU_000099100 [Mayamaea pseudoterrestris]|nr:hypothetical protein MPSEU_000099100 [Mayamaea pseudoterrestris]
MSKNMTEEVEGDQEDVARTAFEISRRQQHHSLNKSLRHHGKKAPMRQVHKKSKLHKSQKRHASIGQQKLTKSKSKSASNAAAAPRNIPVADPFPHRVVNPLLELPPTQTTTHDLNQIVSLIFAPPDTYSIAYLGRLLGWQVPQTARSAAPVAWTHAMQYDTPLLNHESEYAFIPPEGSFYQNLASKEEWLESSRTDPMYKALLSQTQPVQLTAVTATQHLKLTEKIDNLQNVLNVARELGVVDGDDWNVQSLRSHRMKLERAQATYSGIVIDQDFRSSVPPTLSGLVLEREDCLLIAHYEFQWYPLESDYEMILCLNDLQMNGESLLSETLLNSDARLKHMLLIMALVLEQARACNVWYALCQFPRFLQTYMEKYFGMTARRKDQESSKNVCFVCDIHQSSTKLVFLKYLEISQSSSNSLRPLAEPKKHRWIARLPSMDDVAPIARLNATVAKKPVTLRKASGFFANAPAHMRQSAACVRAIMPDSAAEEPMHLFRFDRNSRAELGAINISKNSYLDNISIDLMRDFDLPRKCISAPMRESQLFDELKKRQEDLSKLERGIDPRIRSLMGKVIRERKDYEESGEAQRFFDEQKTIDEYKRTLDRRKQMEKVWQEQLELDMEAVCDVCNDGEVTPDNQILFCESCNVAVHQMCYGIDRIPAGDYYCIPCRYLGRDKTDQRRQEYGGPKLAAAPLPIVCELCPRRQGAFLRSKSDDDSEYGKWVHATCAKWQGLDYVRIPDLVEDVKELKIGFRRLNISCHLCKGARGGMNQCRDCEKWLHVTCARAVGVCEVIHGEDVTGKAKDKAWSLLCPEHSTINIARGTFKKHHMAVEHLVAMANQFPAEPEPDPMDIAPIPFDTATGEERRLLLKNREYEKELAVELSTKRLHGVCCDVCNINTDRRSGRFKCRTCGIVVCDGCILDVEKREGSFRCSCCSWVATKERAGEAFEPPCCIACFQPGGFLSAAFATPVNKKAFWQANKKKRERSLFGRPFWIHSLCAMWHPKPRLLLTGKVDLSDVVMSEGMRLVAPGHVCLLCGQKIGLTVLCDHPDCYYIINGERFRSAFHATCARQAGLEVNSTDDGLDRPYVKCYRHGGNEFNLRAKLEDLIELEKDRAGPSLTRTEQPMKFAHATKLMHLAIPVMRMLSWAWRWAEFWVDYDSTWEVLVEDGQNEEDLSKEELKIVNSTRMSRCLDARRCRLAAFGAALRNRNYDNEDGSDYDRDSFERALRRILETTSLVGPLHDFEMDFYIQWLSLAYWSKSTAMGLGSDKIEMRKPYTSEKSLAMKGSFSYHFEDGSPKFELGDRTLPGKSDDAVVEADDFLRNELSKDTTPQQGVDARTHKLGRPRKNKSPESLRQCANTSKRPRGYKDNHTSSNTAAIDPLRRKRRSQRQSFEDSVERATFVSADSLDRVQKESDFERYARKVAAERESNAAEPRNSFIGPSYDEKAEDLPRRRGKRTNDAISQMSDEFDSSPARKSVPAAVACFDPVRKSDQEHNALPAIEEQANEVIYPLIMTKYNLKFVRRLLPPVTKNARCKDTYASTDDTPLSVLANLAANEKRVEEAESLSVLARLDDLISSGVAPHGVINDTTSAIGGEITSLKAVDRTKHAQKARTLSNLDVCRGTDEGTIPVSAGDGGKNCVEGAIHPKAMSAPYSLADTDAVAYALPGSGRGAKEKLSSISLANCDLAAKAPPVFHNNNMPRAGNDGHESIASTEATSHNLKRMNSSVPDSLATEASLDPDERSPPEPVGGIEQRETHLNGAASVVNKYYGWLSSPWRGKVCQLIPKEGAAIPSQSDIPATERKPCPTIETGTSERKANSVVEDCLPAPNGLVVLGNDHAEASATAAELSAEGSSFSLSGSDLPTPKTRRKRKSILEQLAVDDRAFVLNSNSASSRPRRSLGPSPKKPPAPLSGSKKRAKAAKAQFEADDLLPVSQLVSKLKLERGASERVELAVLKKEEGELNGEHGDAIEAIRPRLEGNITTTADDASLVALNELAVDTPRMRGRLRGKQAAIQLMFPLDD